MNINYHSYLFCILFGMPCLHLFILLHFYTYFWPFVKPISWLLIAWQLTGTDTVLTTDHPSFTKAVSRWCAWHYYGKRLCQPCAGQPCTNLTPRPITVVFGLGMKVCVRMRTKLEWRPTLQTSSEQCCEQLFWPGWISSYEDAEWS